MGRRKRKNKAKPVHKANNIPAAEEDVVCEYYVDPILENRESLAKPAMREPEDAPSFDLKRAISPSSPKPEEQRKPELKNEVEFKPKAIALDNKPEQNEEPKMDKPAASADEVIEYSTLKPEPEIKPEPKKEMEFKPKAISRDNKPGQNEKPKKNEPAASVDEVMQSSLIRVPKREQELNPKVVAKNRRPEFYKELVDESPSVSFNKAIRNSSPEPEVGRKPELKKESEFKPRVFPRDAKQGLNKELKKNRPSSSLNRAMQSSRQKSVPIRETKPKIIIQDEELTLWQQLKSRIFSRDAGASPTRQKTMIALIPVLAIILFFAMRQVFNGSPQKTKAAKIEDTPLIKSAVDDDGEINWIFPDPIPESLRDPIVPVIQNTAQENPEQVESNVEVTEIDLKVSSILHSNNPSAYVAGRVVHINDVIEGVTVVGIEPDCVIFEKDGVRWTETVGRFSSGQNEAEQDTQVEEISIH